MAGIKSDLGGKQMSAPKFKEMVVEDESANNFYEASDEIDMEQADALMRSRGLPPVSPDLKSAYNMRQAQKRALSEHEVLELEMEMKHAKQAKLSGKERLGNSAKQRIELLLGTSRATREVDLDGNVYILKTLKGPEHRAVMMESAKFDGTVEFPFEMRKQILARTVSNVAGVDIDLFLNDSSFEAKLAFIDLMDDVMQDRLYKEYLMLVHETEIKYGLRNPEVMKEVVEDLKK